MLTKDLLIKKLLNSNLNAHRRNFLANKTVRLVLGPYVKNNIIQNNSRPKPNYKIVYCPLKTISLCGIGACGDTKCQNSNSKSFLEKEKERSQKDKVFGKPI